MPSLFSELKRRNVVRVGVAYAVVAWLLMQLAGVLEPALLLPDWVDRVVAVFLLIGFPIVLIFAWAFEITPEGIKLTRSVDPSESITPVTGKKLEHTTIVLLGLVVVFFLAKEFLLSPDDGVVAQAKATPSSIAVLPFQDFSEAKDQEYFSKGISEEILNLLAKTNSLRVAARTSSFAFDKADMDIRDIGTKLDVETVLEGSIRKAGPNIRITAQLINVDDGYHIWSETYERDYTDIFKIQDEIASEIINALSTHLVGDAGAPETSESERQVDLAAYDDYLIGKERLSQSTRDDIEAAAGFFDQAVATDPDFALPHANAAYARLLLELYRYGGNTRYTDEDDARIRGHVERAIELAPDDPDVIGIQGYYYLRRNRYGDAEAALDRAIKLNPSFALAYTWRAETAYEQNRFLDMLADKEKAYSLDPMSLEISADLAFEYRSFWRPKDAERVINRMFALHPEHPLAYNAAIENLQAHGRLGEALLTVDRGLLSNPDDQPLREWKAWLLLQVGLFDDAVAMGVPEPVFVAHLFQGHYDEARSVLDEQLAGENPGDWYGWGREYLRFAGSGAADPKFGEYLDASLAQFEKRNVQWRERCMPFLIKDLRDAGRGDQVDGMMADCQERFEERLKVKYLCPCTFYGVVMYTILDGRMDEAVERADQWLTNGDSMSFLPYESIFAELSDRPEYPELLARNEEQLERQRQIYLTGRSAASAHP